MKNSAADQLSQAFKSCLVVEMGLISCIVD